MSAIFPTNDNNMCHHNSNDSRTSADAVSSQLGETASAYKTNINGRVIRVEGDGRCLFRSLVTCLSNELQKARRDDFGCPLLKNDAKYETLLSDVLRAKVVKLMMDNVHFYGQLERTVINADQPVPSGYSHFRERLQDMTLTTTMPGDLELNATSTCIEKQVLVVDVNLSPIVLYGKDRFPQHEVVVVRFTRLGSCVGHYDAVIPDPDSLIEIGLDPGLYSNNAGHMKLNKSEKNDCFSTHLVPRSANIGRNDISFDKATQVTTQNTLESDDVSNNKPHTSSSPSQWSGEGSSIKNKTISSSSIPCKHCRIHSTARDVMLDLLTENFVFVPGPKRSDSHIARSSAPIQRTTHKSTYRQKLARRNLNRNSNKNQRKDDGNTSRRGSSTTSSYGKGKSKNVRKQKCSLASKASGKMKTPKKFSKSDMRKKTKTTKEDSFTDVDMDQIHPRTLFYNQTPQLADDDVIQDFVNKKCIICRFPISFGQTVVKCGVCLRVAHHHCVVFDESNKQPFYCSFCLANFTCD